MKNKTIRFSLLLFALLSINGLMAQSPRPINEHPADQEVEQDRERSNEGIYERKAKQGDATRSRKHQGKTSKDNRQGKAQKAKASCQGGKNNRASARKGHQHKEARATKLDKTSMKNEIKARKGQWKAQKEAKHHPIFERRANARNGKGE